MVVLITIISLFYWKWRNGGEFILDQQIIAFFCAIVLVMNIPSVLIYLNYYFENKDTSFTIDFDSKKIIITQKETTKEYAENDVQESTYHLGIYYKNVIDRAGRTPMLISDFGYWDLKFKNGDRYFLTNILHDFIHDEPFLENTKYRFRMFTYINKSDSDKAIELKQAFEQRKEKSQTEKFVEKFQSKSESELHEVLNNKSKYQKEAVKAAEIILKNKNVG